MAVVRKTELNWKFKANCFNFLDKAPKGNDLYYLLQKYVTKSIPRRLAPTSDVAGRVLSHVQAFQRAGGDLARARIFEFGAGWDLYSNLVLYCLGATDQTTIDVRRLVRADAINSVIDQLSVDPPAGAIRLPERQVSTASLERDLLGLGIRYLAPADARNTSFADGSIDFILTTSVLEHVPKDILQSIANESHRIISPEGIISHIVDYSDHYSHTDRTITNFNFLRFSESEWSKYNPGIHFQNRLRKRAHKAIFDRAGLEVVEEKSWLEDPAVKVDFPIDQQFAHLREDEIRELGTHFVLRARKV